jgi:hypothetical protein
MTLAVTLLLSAGFALVLARDLTFREGPDWRFQAAATVAMASLATMLAATHSASGRGLKRVEAVAWRPASSRSTSGARSSPARPAATPLC